MDDPSEDKSQWTEGRIQEEITKLLPPDTYLSCDNKDGLSWTVSLVREVETGDEEAKSEGLWSHNQIDKRMALFEAYGHLWLKTQQPSDLMWTPKASSLNKSSVLKYATSKEADPEDLDPDEVASVYEKTKS